MKRKKKEKGTNVGFHKWKLNGNKTLIEQLNTMAKKVAKTG